MAYEIFICYRRKDTGGYAGRLYDHLRQEYGDEGVLFDVEREGTAEVLRDWVRQVIPECAVMLIRIGNHWVVDNHKQRRLEDVDYIVRFEIELALSHGLPIIPVLVDGAELPLPSTLPEPVRSIVEFTGYEINNSYWDARLQLLLEAISSVTKTHVPILRRGVSVWNDWRERNSAIAPSLAFAQLSRTNLFRADLGNADLHGAQLEEVDLREANLRNADLTAANLRKADLEKTKLN